MAVRHVSQTIIYKVFERRIVVFERRGVTKPVYVKRLKAMAIRHMSQTIVFIAFERLAQRHTFIFKAFGGGGDGGGDGKSGAAALIK